MHSAITFKNPVEANELRRKLHSVMQRRDVARFVKVGVSGFLNDIIYSGEGAVDGLVDLLARLVNGAVPMEDLAISKPVRTDYKGRTRPAQWHVAQRMRRRDPNSAPRQEGERVRFVILQGPAQFFATGRAGLKSTRAEDLDHALRRGLPVDRVDPIQKVGTCIRKVARLVLQPRSFYPRVSNVLAYFEGIARRASAYPLLPPPGGDVKQQQAVQHPIFFDLAGGQRVPTRECSASRHQREKELSREYRARHRGATKARKGAPVVKRPRFGA